MSVYCASTDITPLLPSNCGIAVYTTIIANASSLVDAHLAPYYWPFPTAGSTPDTPQIIKWITARLAASDSLLIMGATNRLGDTSAAQTYRTEAMTVLENIQEGRAQVEKQAIADEHITFSASPYDTDEGPFVGSGTKYVIPGSVTISGFEYGEDFIVFYAPQHRCSVIRRLNSSIISGGSGSHVSYEYTYLRHTEVDLPTKLTSGKIYRA